MEITVNTNRETIEALKKLVVEITQTKINPSHIQDSANLFNDCGLDSISVIDLVLGIEANLGVSLDEDELNVGLFQDLSKLSSLVETKKRNAEFD
jgi:acyl carrier protein